MGTVNDLTNPVDGFATGVARGQRLRELALAAPRPNGRDPRGKRSPGVNYEEFYEAVVILVEERGYLVVDACEQLCLWDDRLVDDREEREREDAAVRAPEPGRRWTQIPGEFVNLYQAMTRYLRKRKVMADREALASPHSG